MFDVSITPYNPNANCATHGVTKEISAQCHGSLHIQSNVTASLKLCPAKTRYVLYIINANIVIKKVRKPYRNHLDFNKSGGFFLSDILSLPPNNSKNCPRSQYLLQYTLLPPNIAINSGVRKKTSPSHAKRILKNPSVR